MMIDTSVYFLKILILMYILNFGDSYIFVRTKENLTMNTFNFINYY